MIFLEYLAFEILTNIILNTLLLCFAINLFSEVISKATNLMFFE